MESSTWVFRVICHHLIQQKLLLSNANPDKFPKTWQFPTTNISQIELDNLEGSSHRTCGILRDSGFFESECTAADIAILQHVAAVVSSRASQLVAVCLGVLLKRINESQETVIAVDGSLYKHHPRLRGWIEGHLRQMCPQHLFRLHLALDGSGKGAALVAAIADRLAKRQQLYRIFVSETGKYLALDLGGTNFRVLLLELVDGVGVREEVEHFVISDEIRLGEGVALFDRLAECLESFIVRLGLTDERLALGFTFSFPMKHHGIASGTLVTWTKSFNCANVEGKCAVKLLREAIARRQKCQMVDVVAIVNDTTGTLMQGALVESRTRIGMILGTGSNACFMEAASRVQHWETTHADIQNVAVDIEWGAFGDNGRIDFIKTPFDSQVKKATSSLL
uniref:Phosphotransferase n=1 Tax=Phlebotomus papatasi TaxID=29031 RepID=A0A1B0D4S8_PHLPP